MSTVYFVSRIVLRQDNTGCKLWEDLFDTDMSSSACIGLIVISFLVQGQNKWCMKKMSRIDRYFLHRGFCLENVVKRYTGSRSNALVQNRHVRSHARTSSKKMMYEENEPYRWIFYKMLFLLGKCGQTLYGEQIRCTDCAKSSRAVTRTYKFKKNGV